MPDFRFKMKDGTWGLFKARVRVSWDVPSAGPSAAEYSRWKMAHGGYSKSVSRCHGMCPPLGLPRQNMPALRATPQYKQVGQYHSLFRES